MGMYDIPALVEAQRSFFHGGATLPLDFRRQRLAELYVAVKTAEKDIAAALHDDLGKSGGEAYMTETGIVLSEIAHVRRWLGCWARPRLAWTPLALMPALSRTYAEPFGLALVLAPWNYPFHLALLPLVDAVAAGNCVLLKPSSRAPATTAVLERLVSSVFDPEHAAVVAGDAETGEALLAERFDFIFYTGSTAVGKKVMAAAARHLTPVCLELGGKSPAIVLKDADLGLAARRIAWGKAVNAGQTCVAPDYVLADAAIKARLVSLLQDEFRRFPGPDAVRNPEYARIVSPAALDRLIDLSGGQAVFDRQTMRMAPLVMPDVMPDVGHDTGSGAAHGSPVMQAEIFGPLLPVIAVSGPDEAAAFVRAREKPLACYLFTSSRREAGALLKRLSFGGGCVNDVLVHVGSHYLPFGGVGNSGMGRYHGKAGFELFSNRKSVVHGWARMDNPLRYPPFSTLAERLMRLFLR